MVKFIIIFFFIFNKLCFGQIINFKDENLKKSIVDDINKHQKEKIDRNNDGEIDINEANTVTKLFLSYSNIKNIEDLKYFKNLKILDLSNNLIKEAVFENWKYLEKVVIDNNLLETLEFKNCPNLISVYCPVNNLTTIKFIQVTKLESLMCSVNKINYLDFAEIMNLKFLICNINELSSIDLSVLKNLVSIECTNNHLTQLDFSQNKNITFIFADDNKLLEKIILNTNFINNLNFNGCEKLRSIVTTNNEFMINYLNSRMKKYNLHNVVLSIVK